MSKKGLAQLGTVAPSSMSRAREVADRLESHISQLAPGDHVGRKEELRTQLGIAAGTLNEALRLLQERGLIEVKPGPRGGVFATSPDPVLRLGQTLVMVRGRVDALEEAVEVRTALEPLTVLHALRARSETAITQLRAQLGEIEAGIQEDDHFLRSIWQLHVQIAALGDNEMVKAMYLGVMRVIEDGASGVVPTTKTMAYKRRRLAIHQALVDAIAAQDEAAAQKALRAHTLAH